MDSLTQFVLGAAVATAGLGKVAGPRKAAIAGGLVATLPDLDVFLPFADPVDSFVYHRGWTHSLLVHAALAAPLGEVLRRLLRLGSEQRLRVIATVLLCLTTHALLDAMTVYGTRLFWPLYPDPVGVGSVFIIDPLYTLPLLALFVWVLVRARWSRGTARATAVALAMSTAYLGLATLLQHRAEARALSTLEARGIRPDLLLATPTPFNTAVWTIVAVDGDRYHTLYPSIFDGEDAPPVVHSHSRGADLLSCLGPNEALAKLAWFSRGFLAAEREGEHVVVSDLRMGLSPAFVFRFAVARVAEHGIDEIAPRRVFSKQRMVDDDLDWLGKRLAGEPVGRPAELSKEAATEDLAGADLSVCRAVARKSSMIDSPLGQV
jgi:inner membrane protein